MLKTVVNIITVILVISAFSIMPVAANTQIVSDRDSKSSEFSNINLPIESINILDHVLKDNDYNTHTKMLNKCLRDIECWESLDTKTQKAICYYNTLNPNSDNNCRDDVCNKMQLDPPKGLIDKILPDHTPKKACNLDGKGWTKNQF